MDFTKAEIDFTEELPKALVSKDFPSLKTLDVRSRKASKAKPLASETHALNEWLSREEWGRVSSTERKGLLEAEAQPVIDLLGSVGYDVSDFLVYIQMPPVTTIGRNVDNIVALLISIVRKMPAFARAYSGEKRRFERFDGSPGKRSE